jgi:hypothetical protein
MATVLAQRYIAKLKSPVERASCKPKREDHDTGGFQSWTVEATGAYAKRKEFQGDDGPPDAYPCSDLGGNDVMTSAWLYNPTESQTRFLYLAGPGEYEMPFDFGSIHFRTEP